MIEMRLRSGWAKAGMFLCLCGYFAMSSPWVNAEVLTHVEQHSEDIQENKQILHVGPQRQTEEEITREDNSVNGFQPVWE